MRMYDDDFVWDHNEDPVMWLVAIAYIVVFTITVAGVASVLTYKGIKWLTNTKTR